MTGRHRKPSAVTKQKQALRVGVVTAPLAAGLMLSVATNASADEPNQSQGFTQNQDQSQGFTQNQDQSQGFTQNQDQSQGFTQNQDQNQGFTQNQDQNQGFTQNQDQSQGFTQNQGFTQTQGGKVTYSAPMAAQPTSQEDQQGALETNYPLPGNGPSTPTTGFVASSIPSATQTDCANAALTGTQCGVSGGTLDPNSQYPVLQRGVDRYYPMTETYTSSNGTTVQDPTKAWKLNMKLASGDGEEFGGEAGETYHGNQHTKTDTKTESVNIYPASPHAAHFEERRNSGDYNGGWVTVTGQDEMGNPAPVDIDDNDSYSYYPNPDAKTSTWVTDNPSKQQTPQSKPQPKQQPLPASFWYPSDYWHNPQNFDSGINSSLHEVPSILRGIQSLHDTIFGESDYTKQVKENEKLLNQLK